MAFEVQSIPDNKSRESVRLFSGLTAGYSHQSQERCS